MSALQLLPEAGLRHWVAPRARGYGVHVVTLELAGQGGQCYPAPLQVLDLQGRQFELDEASPTPLAGAPAPRSFGSVHATWSRLGHDV